MYTIMYIYIYLYYDTVIIVRDSEEIFFLILLQRFATVFFFSMG